MKAMKRILIVNNNLHIGGVQKALISLLWGIRGQYDVTLLLLHKTGELLSQLPPEVKVLTVTSGFRYLGMTKQGRLTFFQKLGRSPYAAITRLFGLKYAVKLMGLGQKKLRGFDVAISYLHNGGEKVFYGGCNDFVLNHVQAPKKITFLHCDYTLSGADTAQNKAQYSRFDRIAACSQGCADAFLKARPELKDKVRVAYNCHRFDKLLADAQASPVTLTPDKLNIVTVARLGKEKGVERALRAIAALDAHKEKLHYYIIGDGIQKPLLLKIIQEQKLENTVTLCGMLSNPCGYIKAADLLLIPSYSEAAPLVIGEAACLGTPVLSTETSSAREMIEKPGLGWVCENSEQAMTEALKALLSDPAALQKPLGESSSNEQALRQFADCIE